MWEIIQAAGWPIWPLILTSIIGVAIILERFWSLRKSQIIPEGLMIEINTMIKHLRTLRLQPRPPRRAVADGALVRPPTIWLCLEATLCGCGQEAIRSR